MKFINNEQRCSLIGKWSTLCSAPTIYSINTVKGSAVPKQETGEPRNTAGILVPHVGLPIIED